ncbi:MAG: metallophosphoesterase family protein [Candidatus Binatia bacterium]
MTRGASRGTRVGLISDTHGLLRPEAVAALRGSDRIIHGGDIGDAAVLTALAAIAPVTAVRGNNDCDPWAHAVDETALLQVDDVAIYVVHDVADLRRTPPPHGTRVVVSGHSHKPGVVERDGVLYVNPGSAGPRRFTLPIAVAELLIEGSRVDARIVELAVAPAARTR